MSNFALDPAFVSAVEPLIEKLGIPQMPDVMTVGWMRETSAPSGSIFGELIGVVAGVGYTSHDFQRPDGSSVALRWYTSESSRTAAAGVYIHGGGMVLADLDVYDAIIARYVAEAGTPLLAVEYGLAPEQPYPAALDDCVGAVHWLCANATTLGVDPARIAVVGDSGGGALAAATALWCRDHDISLAMQILIYPMLDDRTRTPDPLLASFAAGWSHQHNAVAWDAVLGQAAPSPYAAPARATSLAGLPRTYMDTGELDIFRAEILDYAARLTAAGVSTELHLHPGVPHAYELLAPDIDVSKRTLADRYRALRSF